MSLIQWEPYREMVSLRDAMSRLFEESLVRPSRRWTEAAGAPVQVDMKERDEDLVVTADLPGLDADDVDVNISNNTLMLKGEFEAEEETEKGTMHIKERRYGKFQRAIPLPTAVEVDNAEAEFEDGVLQVMLPKAEKAKPKQIPVNVQ